jgi:HD-GYP domain-containing protein (c-di-GMP phosphodiesterase class II)
MKLDKTSETLLVFMAVLVIIVTAYYVEDISLRNNVSLEYNQDMSHTGVRLSDKVYSTCQKVKQWKNAKDFGLQFEFTVYNNEKSNISNWTIEMEIPEDGEIADCWNTATSIKDGVLYLTPLSYNSMIPNGDQITFGFIINTKDNTFYPTFMHLVGYKAAIVSDSAIKRLIYIAFVIWAVLFVGFFVTRFNLKNYREKQKTDVKIILQSMNTFINFIDAKDPYTRGHSRRVAMYAAEIAKRMHLSEDEVQNVYYAGLLHDAGKISVPDAVLNKPGKLTDDERRQIQEHTIAGGDMLKQLSSLRGIRETALYHHERYDGKGYPEGLKGEAIPLYARIVGVADSYDAMFSNRVYRRHLNKDEIIEEIQQGAATQFDPNIVVYMIDMINDGYVNVVKMETAEREEGRGDFHLTEDDIPGVYMGL